MTGTDRSRDSLYARVSGDQQVEDDTIASQLDLLERRILQDGRAVTPELRFIDDGYGGETLLRPGLERLRDTAAAGAIDRLYVEDPDRLARDYAYQMVLVDELRHHGVEIVFLNGDLGRGPEGRLLLQVQGIIAEYERTKIRERCRRGRLFAARSGRVSVAGRCPLWIPLCHEAGRGRRGPLRRVVRRSPDRQGNVHMVRSRRMFVVADL